MLRSGLRPTGGNNGPLRHDREGIAKRRAAELVVAELPLLSSTYPSPSVPPPDSDSISHRYS